MSAVIRPQRPATLGYSAIASAAPVRGVTWQAVADAVNHLLGTGYCRTLIPQTGAQSTIAATTTATLRFKVWPSIQATHRVWSVNMGATAGDEAPPANVIFTDPSGGTTTWNDPGGTGRDYQRGQIWHIEEIATRTSAESVLAPTITTTDAGVFTGLSCFEVGRPELTIDSSDLGLETASFAGGVPIFDGVGYSLGALPEAQAAALAMRRHLFAWAVPATDTITINSGSAAALFAYDPPLLDRQIYRSETQVEVTVWIYSRSDATTAGKVEFSMTSGGLCTISVPANDAGTWRSGTLAVDAELLSAADGRRSTRFDRCAITGTRTSGAGALYVDSISIVGRAG